MQQHHGTDHGREKAPDGGEPPQVDSGGDNHGGGEDDSEQSDHFVGRQQGGKTSGRRVDRHRDCVVVVRNMILDVHALDCRRDGMRDDRGQKEEADRATGGDGQDNRPPPRGPGFEKPYRHGHIDRPQDIGKEQVDNRQDMRCRVLGGQISPQQALDQLLHPEDQRDGRIGNLHPFMGATDRDGSDSKQSNSGRETGGR